MDRSHGRRLILKILSAALVSLAICPQLFADVPPKKSATQQEKIDAIESRKSTLENELNTLNKNKACVGDGECEVLEVGFRLCGGPSHFMVISVSNPQIAKVKAKAAELTAVEKEMNLVNPPLDCTPAPTAPEASCIKGTCDLDSKPPPPKSGL